jgi:tetratricopeptide (TPR) repeat protein
MKNWYASSLAVLLVLGSPAWGASASEGLGCLSAGDLSCAIAVRDELVAARPNEIPTLRLQLRVLFREGAYEDAVGVLQTLEDRGETVDNAEVYRNTLKATVGMTQVQGDGIELRHGGGMEAVLEEDALQVMVASRTTYDGLFGGGPDHDVLLDIFPTARRFIWASGLPPEAVRTTGVIALSKWSRLLITSPRSKGRGYGWKDTVAHEYIHLVVAFRTGDRAPVWLHEGLAKHLESRWRNSDAGGLSAHQQSLLAKAIRSGEFVPFEKFKHSMAYLDSGSEAALAFAQVSTMIAYLLETAGDAALPGVLDRIRDGEAADLVVAEAAGHSSFEQFRAGWLSWLKARPLIQAEIASLPVVLDGSGGTYADDPLLGARADLARFARLGDLLLAADRPMAALVEFRKAADPDSPPSPLLMAREATCLLQLEQPTEALKTVIKGVKMYPEYTVLTVVHARILDSLGRQHAAVEAWQAAHDLNPFDPEVQASLAADLEAIGQTTRAERHRRYGRILSSGGSSSAELR